MKEQMYWPKDCKLDIHGELVTVSIFLGTFTLTSRHASMKICPGQRPYPGTELRLPSVLIDTLGNHWQNPKLSWVREALESLSKEHLVLT
jgi:hypothetical protein